MKRYFRNLKIKVLIILAVMGPGIITAFADNDAGGLFRRLGDQVITGPTGTNLNDFRAIYVPGPSR